MLRIIKAHPPTLLPPTLCRKVVVRYREDCRQLDADPRLAPGAGSGAAGAREQQEEMQGRARGLSQAISALGSAVKADVEQVGPGRPLGPCRGCGAPGRCKQAGRGTPARRACASPGCCGAHIWLWVLCD